MNKILVLLITLCCTTMVQGQVLSLDSCRAKALRSNKQMRIARVKLDVAQNTRKSARTKYLPHIDIAGGYMHTSRQVSILNDTQKGFLSNFGTTAVNLMGQHAGNISNAIEQLTKAGKLTEAEAKAFSNIMQHLGPVAGNTIATIGNEMGQKIRDAFETDTRNMYVASAQLVQPLFMAGAITAGNNMADIAEHMAATNIEAKEHDILFDVDNAYWTVVSLRQKQKLAESYLALVQKLNDDVHKMIEEGVATRADGLKVDVAVNEADMTKAKVDNGLTLSKMYLCKLCGMELSGDIVLADEEKEDITLEPMSAYDMENAFGRRTELSLLSDLIDISREKTKIARSTLFPHVALVGGVVFSNPSVFNGFENKFKGMWNVGVMLQMPLLDWGDRLYKIRASRCATTLAQLEYDEAHELIELQLSQCNFKVREANKNLATAKKNIARAEENLRCATLGFKEGVMQTTDVMAAQTAWLQAKTQKIDAEIDVKMSETALKKAAGF